MLRSNLLEDATVESVRDKWSEITNMDSNPDFPTAPEEAMGKFMDALRLQEKGLGDRSGVTRQNLVEVPFPDMKHTYKVNDTILYALGCEFIKECTYTSTNIYYE